MLVIVIFLDAYSHTLSEGSLIVVCNARGKLVPAIAYSKLYVMILQYGSSPEALFMRLLGLSTRVELFIYGIFCLCTALVCSYIAEVTD